MKFGGIGVPELLIILVVVLLIFGPKNLPKLGNAVGKTVKNLREGMGGSDKELDEAEQEAEEAQADQPAEKKSTASAKKPAAKRAAAKKRPASAKPQADDSEE